MSTKDNYALNWPQYHEHLKRGFSNLLQCNDFTDVTLSCEGKKLKAHRIILSTFSPYFHDLLMDNLCSHPIIVLRDVEYQNMLNILEFMYLGEVQISHERFGSFLKTAEMLKVSGLGSDTDEKGITSPVQEKIKSTPTMRPGPASKKAERLRAAESKKRLSEVEKEETGPETKKRKEKSASPQNVRDADVAEQENAKSNEPGTPANIQKLLQDEIYLTKEANPENECPICAQKFTTMYLLKQHIPFHKGETKCEYCNSIFSRRDLLKKHLAAVHKITASGTKKD